MSQDVAVVRSAESLQEALTELESLSAVGAPFAGSVPEAELRNVLLLAREVTRSALVREESRGGHFRVDFPEPSPDLEGEHLVVTRRAGGYTRSFSSLDLARLRGPARAG
jgi:L-aspartate oxidase